ncbi:MAG: outer membrane protein assembly factor BamC [Burkholderiaceae bacterium]
MTVISVRSSLIIISVCALALSACSATGSGQDAEYRSAGSRPPLDIPPDLVTPTSNDRYQIPEPGKTTTLSQYERSQRDKSAQTSALTPSFSQVAMERSGQLRWLRVNLPADQVWQRVREFWLDSGFLISEESAETGVMQTDWAEKTAKISGGLIRDSLSRVFGTRYSTSERDAFRSRLESVDGGTEVYISHRGMEEVFTNDTQDGNTKWQPRPTDHQLEVEFLRRLMTFLGISVEDATKAVASTTGEATPLATMVEGQGMVGILRINEGFDRAWRRIGLALDRGSFTVEDRNRAEGTYFVRYIDTDKAKDKSGFFSNLFGGEKPADAVKYQIMVTAAGDKTDVSVKAGEAPATATASDETSRRILAVIQEKLGN